MSNSKPKIIVVLGREWGSFVTEPAECQKVQINNTVVISTPDASNLNDKHMLDLMALTYPGPHLFLVRLEGKQPERELRKWEFFFGENFDFFDFDNMRYITDRRYDNIKISCKCIGIKEDMIIQQCERINNPATYRFGEFLIRRRKQIENKMPAEMETDQSSSPPDVPSPVPGDQQKSRQLTLVLIGEQGSGKSASGNTILGMKAFKSEPSSMPVTTECETKTKSICGTEVTVIDTPYFFDDSLKEKSTDILRCRELCEGGLCVYLLAIQIGRFTEGERDILERLEKALQTRVRDRAIILFTRGDDLSSHIDEYVRDIDPHLQELIKKCGGRYQGINNKTEVEKQVKELMRKIAVLVKTPDGVKVFPEYDAKRSGCV